VLNTYVIEGGIGKCTAFTAVVPKLKEKAGEGIQVYTPYIDVCAFNPDISMGYEQTIPLNDERILASDNIYYCEPYKSNFVFGKQHIIESYCEHFGIEYDPSMTPKIYTDHLKDRAKEVLEKLGVTGKYMLVQFSGGQSPIAFNAQNPYHSVDPNRNYPHYLAQEVIKKLNVEFPDVTIINATLPNEPNYEGTIKFEEHWAVMHEVLKNAEGFIGIDSCVNHFSPSAKTRGVVLWGSTRWTQFGYEQNINLQYHMGKEWDETKFKPQDPRNLLVDPDVVVGEYKNLFSK